MRWAKSRVRSAGWSLFRKRRGRELRGTPGHRTGEPQGAGFRENAKETSKPGWRRKVLRGTAERRKERPSGHRAVGRKAGCEVRAGEDLTEGRRCRKAATEPLEIPRVTTLILKPRREAGGRRPARVAGRGEEDTRKLDRLPGEKPGTEVRSARAEAGSGRSLEWSLGTLFLLPVAFQAQEPSPRNSFLASWYPANCFSSTRKFLP